MTFTQLQLMTFLLTRGNVKHLHDRIISLLGRFIPIKLFNTATFLKLKCMYQAMKVSGNVFVFSWYRFCLMIHVERQ
jgi:hypothetical protein